MVQALNNWGNAFADLARLKIGEEAKADLLFAEAEKKYEAALALNPDMAEALFNWGSALLDQGGTKGGRR